LKIRALTGEQIQALTPQQLQALTPQQLEELKRARDASPSDGPASGVMSFGQMRNAARNLTAEQLAQGVREDSYPADQVREVLKANGDSAKLAAFEAALTAWIRAITPEKIAQLKTRQIKALTPQHIAALTAEQIGAMTPEQLEVFVRHHEMVLRDDGHKLKEVVKVLGEAASRGSQPAAAALGSIGLSPRESGGSDAIEALSSAASSGSQPAAEVLKAIPEQAGGSAETPKQPGSGLAGGDVQKQQFGMTELTAGLAGLLAAGILAATGPVGWVAMALGAGLIVAVAGYGLYKLGAFRKVGAAVAPAMSGSGRRSFVYYGSWYRDPGSHPRRGKGIPEEVRIALGDRNFRDYGAEDDTPIRSVREIIINTISHRSNHPFNGFYRQLVNLISEDKVFFRAIPSKHMAFKRDDIQSKDEQECRSLRALVIEEEGKYYICVTEPFYRLIRSNPYAKANLSTHEIGEHLGAADPALAIYNHLRALREEVEFSSEEARGHGISDIHMIIIDLAIRDGNSKYLLRLIPSSYVQEEDSEVPYAMTHYALTCLRNEFRSNTMVPLTPVATDLTELNEVASDLLDVLNAINDFEVSLNGRLSGDYRRAVSKLLNGLNV
jgi:hypothetical protein